jgi:hypothetical protein
MSSTPEPSAAQDWLVRLFSARNLWLCTVISVVVICMPPEGLSFDLCMYKNLTHAPCPGCGLTRSGANLVRGNFGRAIDYNPFGLVFMPTLFGLGLVALLPQSVRQAISNRLLPWAKPLWWACWLLLIAFVLHGVVRTIAVICGWATFPASWL